MHATTNIRRLGFKELMTFKRFLNEGNTLNEFKLEDLPLISGSGNNAFETEFNIINDCPVWKELLNEQKNEPVVNARKKCDVYISCDGGFIPCHRPFLKMSKFLDDLVTENMNSNMSSKDVCITLTGVHINQLKAALTLFYTGACIINESTYDDFTELLKLLQIDKDNWTKDPKFNENCRNERFRSVKVFNYIDDGVVGKGAKSSSHRSMNSANTESRLSRSSERPNVTTSFQDGAIVVQDTSVMSTITSLESTISDNFEGPSTSFHHITNVSRIPNVTTDMHFIKNQKNMIRGRLPGRHKVSRDKYDRASLPEVRKVLPGTVKIKAPRIIRTRAPGPDNANNGSKLTDIAAPNDDKESLLRDSIDKSCVYNFDLSDDTVISNKEKNDADLDYLASEKHIPADKNFTTLSLYSLRKRKKPESYFEESRCMNKPYNQDKPIVRTSKIKVESSETSKKLRKAMIQSSNGSGEDPEEFRCKYCYLDNEDVYALKHHLEEKCAKEISNTFNIVTKHCKSCKSFFTHYNAVEFMYHVDVCNLFPQTPCYSLTKENRTQTRQSDNLRPESAGTRKTSRSGENYKR